MRILLDENLPRKLTGHLVSHTCRTVVECGWAGKKNGELLDLADPQFDVLLTLDKDLPYQQNLDTKRIAVLIVRARRGRTEFRTYFRSFQNVLRRSRESSPDR